MFPIFLFKIWIHFVPSYSSIGIFLLSNCFPVKPLRDSLARGGRLGRGDGGGGCGRLRLACWGGTRRWGVGRTRGGGGLEVQRRFQFVYIESNTHIAVSGPSAGGRGERERGRPRSSSKNVINQPLVYQIRFEALGEGLGERRKSGRFLVCKVKAAFN